MADSQSRGWGPGWPNCQSGKIKTLSRADGVKLPLRVELIELVAHLADETERRGYNLVPGWCWGYACRPIRGTRTASNHSWGLAVDLNAPKNPMGRAFITDMPGWMPMFWEAHMFRWGGTYRSRPDAMHYEFMGTPADAIRITNTIRKGTAPVKVVNALPLVVRKGTKADPYTKNCLVAQVQEDLNVWIAKYKIRMNPVKVDGVYGPATGVYVTAFKNWVRRIQKETKQPVWPNSDTTMGPLTYGTLQFWTD